MNLDTLLKRKRIRMVTVSAGTLVSGIQGLHLDIYHNKWILHAHTHLPYPQKIRESIDQIITSENPSIACSDSAWLEYHITKLFVEFIRTTQSLVPKTQSKPNVILMNTLTLWRGRVPNIDKEQLWNLSCGDAQVVASTFSVPVFTDFIRHDIVRGNTAALPLNPGIISAGEKIPGEGVVIVNIGILSHLIILDKKSGTLLVASDTGPGTALINRAAATAGCPEGFDRDGSVAQQGTINHDCLEQLASTPWFLRPAPKRARVTQFQELYDSPCIMKLTGEHKVATLTALTARTIYDFYKREYHGNSSPDSVYISGGGAHNLALLDYLKAYFDPVPVTTIESAGIPNDAFVPLALSLATHSYFRDHALWRESAAPKRISSPGKWILP
jgi:anhydro-N-acetylmuramic acid kinase